MAHLLNIIRIMNSLAFMLFFLLDFSAFTSATASSVQSSDVDISLPNTSERWTWSTGLGSCGRGREYMCIDWSFGSRRMITAQNAFARNTFFGVGSYGNRGNLGKCYQFYTDSTSKRFIAQVINYGTDVSTGQFDMQMGAGGFGIFNACTRDQYNPRNRQTQHFSQPMFSEGFRSFGMRFGGQPNRQSCQHVPLRPANRGYIPPGEPSVRELCIRSHAWGARKPGNPNIRHIKRVKCPQQLYRITGLRLRSDNYNFNKEEKRYGKLTSTFDCCKPAAAWPRNEWGGPNYNADPNFPNVRACKVNGYTRVGRQ